MATLHMRLDFPVPKGPLGPSNSTICLRTPPESPRICAHWPPTAPSQKQTISWATWLKNAISRAPNPPATIHFKWFPPLKIALTEA